MRSRGVPLTVLAATLTLATGAMDVASFARLGQVFASVMTGNLVLLGFAAARASGDLAVHTVIAFVGYITGVGVGTRLAGRPDAARDLWPHRVTLTLAVEILVLAGFAAGWELTGTRPAGGAQLGLLAVVTVATGLQAAAVRALGHHVSISTTYLTGTLTAAVATLVGPPPRHVDVRRIAILCAAAIGAAAGGALLIMAPAALPAVPLAALIGVVVAAVALRDRLSTS